MKNISLKIVFVLTLLAGKHITAQTVLTLQPGAAAGKDAYLHSLFPTTPQPNYPEYDAIDWTSGGDPFTSRSVIEFDISPIPAGSTINSAYLSLYGVPGSGNTQGSIGNNECYLQRITESWDENTVTWNNQPAITNTNQVTLSQSSSITQDYLNIDVTDLYQDMVDNASSSFGLLIKLVTEQLNNSMVLGSSDNTDASKHPKVVITYTPPGNLTCETLQGTEASADAYLHSMFPSTNYGSYVEFDAIDWTVGGTEFTSRSTIEFDYSSIPANAVISSATLSLYGNPASSNTQGSIGSNTCYLRRINSAWTMGTVTWANQPTTTTQNQVTIPASTSIAQDYPAIDVTDLVIDDINDTNNSGFILKLASEVLGNSMVFCGTHFTDPAKRPKLVVCYTFPEAVTTTENTASAFQLYPNPSDDYFFISGKNTSSENLAALVYDLNGKKVATRQLTTGMVNEQFDFSAMPGGIYFIKVIGNKFEQHLVFSKQ